MGVPGGLDGGVCAGGALPLYRALAPPLPPALAAGPQTIQFDDNF